MRVSEFNNVAFRGISDGMTTDRDPDGIARGVATSEFHFENGGTRPIQVVGDLTLNNGVEPDTMGTMSTRLE